MIVSMIVEQTIDVPADRRVILEIPPEVPVGSVHLFIQFSIHEDTQTGDTFPPEAKGQIKHEAFREVLRRAYGAWKNNPWTSHLKDIDAMRDEWEHRDPWKAD